MKERKKVLIVGGVAGGATAVARLRRLDQQAEIILFERGEYISYANCGLPYYIGGVIENRDNLLVTTKETFEARYHIDIRPENEVLTVDPKEKTVRVMDHKKNREYEESYDQLILSTGSSPIVPDLPGIHGDNVFTLWTIPDTDRIYNFVAEQKPEKAVVVGGGFIGIEVAENLVERGIQVTLVEKMPQVMTVYDPDMSKLLEDQLKEHGVILELGKGLASIAEDGQSVTLDNGDVLESDMVVLSIGTRPNGQLAKDAGLEINARGGIVTDGWMQTSDPFIYAVGDVAEVTDLNTGGRCMMPLAGPANKQGRIVADNIHGEKNTTYKGTQGSSVVKVFDLDAAVTGLTERALKRMGKEHRKDYLVVVAHPGSHASYYPGSFPMTLKLIFDMEGKVLGAQAIGMAGVDKRIDVLATAIRFNATVYDLQELELVYAPPFSSAKDPVNIAGFMAADQLEGLSEGILQRELENQPVGTVILDIRETPETAIGMIPGAVSLPLSELYQRLNELDNTQNYVVYCSTGLRSYIAERTLKAAGFKVKNLLGGYRSFCDAKEVPNPKPIQNTGMEQSVNEKVRGENMTKVMDTMELDACGLACPGPIMSVNQAMQNRQEGERLKVYATDPGFAKDIASWCENTGNVLIESGKEGHKFTATIQKGQLACAIDTRQDALCVKEKTMIVFSGDLDKAIASFIIANGAAAMGNQVNMFFTFWGLNILRKPKKQRVQKDFMGKMFSAMMPRGAKKLGLSRMNFGGAGAKMIRGIMKKNNVSSLEELIDDALKAGVKITACQMSMDLMGIQLEEMIDGIEVGGVAAMLNDNDHSNMNLFI
jgi:NADPH-dependent 2,4-dienoyl-CoA reductase/sulfur reductase-like enzyme/peroxiredoxin family protein/TusA-related sulfurtransferase/rhodanese-related sulfurtransferase